jgi:hypothetical protein
MKHLERQVEMARTRFIESDGALKLARRMEREAKINNDRAAGLYAELVAKLEKEEA